MNSRIGAPNPQLVAQGLPMALMAVLIPTLLAADDPPSITFYNQALGVLGWGAFMAWLAWRTGPLGVPGCAQPSGPFKGMSVVLWLMAGSALGSVFATGLPLGLALMAASLALSAWWVMHTIWHAAHRWSSTELMDLLALALAWTGVASVALAAIQVFVPEWTDGFYLAQPVVSGRAVGNLRQPNHLSTLLVWSACGALWLGRRGRWPTWAALLLYLLCVGAVVWTASRTGMLAMALLTLWGVRDAHMPRLLRMATLGAPLVYGAWWLGMAWWAQQGSGHAFAAQARLNDGSDISSSRFKIWSDTLELIWAHPWTGVGWGEFNLAWTFSEFPNRPVAFFDHTHNIVLQWAVELGLPLAAVLVALCAWGLWALWWPWRTPDPEASGALCATSTIVTLAAVHSLLEYPLWYSYFLLPTACAFGLGLAVRAQTQAHPIQDQAAAARQGAGTTDYHSPPTSLDRLAWAGGVAMMLGALWCALDYQWAANIYAPRPGADTLVKRIDEGRKRLWWGYQADYALVNAPEEDEPSLPPQAFARTLHNLVDARLMVAYARSLAEHGQVDRARYVVQRLQEFRHKTGKAFLEVCADAPASGPERPFQCDPPRGKYTWRDVVP